MWYFHRESNPDQRFRKPTFYPLNYGSLCGWNSAKVRLFSYATKLIGCFFMANRRRMAHPRPKRPTSTPSLKGRETQSPQLRQVYHIDNKRPNILLGSAQGTAPAIGRGLCVLCAFARQDIGDFGTIFITAVADNCRLTCRQLSATRAKKRLRCIEGKKSSL